MAVGKRDGAKVVVVVAAAPVLVVVFRCGVFVLFVLSGRCCVCLMCVSNKQHGSTAMAAAAPAGKQVVPGLVR